MGSGTYDLSGAAWPFDFGLTSAKAVEIEKGAV